MLISDWSSDVCSSDLEINQLVCPVRRHAGMRNERVVAAPNHVLGKDSRFRGQQRKHCDAQQSVGLDPGGGICRDPLQRLIRSEEHTSELQSLMRISYAVFCLKKKIQKYINTEQLH